MFLCSFILYFKPSLLTGTFYTKFWTKYSVYIAWSPGQDAQKSDLAKWK